MTILFLHGWQSTPGGVKPTFLKDHGHEVLNPALPDEDFDAAVSHRPGRVRPAPARCRRRLQPGRCRRHEHQLGFDAARAALPGLEDDGERPRPSSPARSSCTPRPTTWCRSPTSEELVRNSGLPASALIEVGHDHRLADPGVVEGDGGGVRSVLEMNNADHERTDDRWQNQENRGISARQGNEPP